jgi:hypothetical protein
VTDRRAVNPEILNADQAAVFLGVPMDGIHRSEPR